MKALLMLLALLLMLLAFTTTVEAQGSSYLGMCHKDWNCDGTIASYRGRKTFYLSWLINTFGTECQCVKKLMADPRKKVVRVHLSNSPCMRNHRCGRYEVFYKMNKASASRAVVRGDKRIVRYFDKQLNELAVLFSSSKNLTCYVSPCLECDLNATARRVLLDRVSAALPMCIPVDNPHGQPCLKGFLCESHGENPTANKPCIVDLDGKDGRTIDVRKWVERYRHCDLAFYWEPYMNCNRGSFVDPRQRDCKYDNKLFIETKRILCRSFLRPLFATCSH